MGAHVHGVSTLELAIEGDVVELSLTAPGMDIVGFEYAASTDADKDAVEAAIRKLLVPENIVTLATAAKCRLTEGLAHLGADNHDHAQAAGHADHDDHAAGKDHSDTASAAHNEFHARYVFVCEDSAALTTIGFPFFTAFENAQEIEAQFVTEAGAGAAEIGRDTAELNLN